MATLRQRIEEALGSVEPKLIDAFLAAIDDLRAGARISDMIAALERRDVEAVIEAINLDPAVYGEMQALLTDLFRQVGVAQTAFIPGPPGSAIRFRFDMQHPAAERAIRETSAALVTRLAEQDREVARQVILSGFEAGRHPNGIALDLVGRVDKLSRRRIGGNVGLSAPFADHVAAMRARLASGNPDEMRKVLEMTRRDKRFDRSIQKLIDEGRALDQASIDKVVGRYADRLVETRGRAIARTETGASVMSARHASFRQALSKTNYPEEAVTRTWVHGGGVLDPRWWHVQMNGVSVRGLTEPFALASGARMMHPLDMSAGAHECANCSCSCRWEIDYSWGL